jgi:alpha-tubulin suppressor-like RCC1 family protein
MRAPPAGSRGALAPLLWVSVLLWLAACDPAGPGPVAVEGGFMAVAAGGEHTCGITLQGSVYCWGSNEHGQLGTGARGGRAAVPTRTVGSFLARAIAAGASHTCAIDVSDRLYCWGANGSGQLGIGTRTDADVPTAVPSELVFRSVSLGVEHTCALAGNRAFCWGASTHGQAGIPGGEVLTPIEFAPALRFAAISAGGIHTCGIDGEGVALCWGGDTQAQLGDSSLVSRAEPRPIRSGHRYREIATGHAHTCAIRTDGNVQCWGSNDHGELGEGGAPSNRGGPVAFYPWDAQGLERARGVTLGRFLSCTLVGDTLPDVPGDTAWCWGRGGEGQVGTGSIRDHYVAQWVRHADLSWIPLVFHSISAGTEHVCGIADATSIFCWGRGSAGQLGTGEFRGSTMPVRVRESR